MRINKLQYRKAGAAEHSTKQEDWFSFDLGGTLLGGAVNGDMFAAECKRYTLPRNQGIEYRRFLSKCYRVESAFPQFFEHYFWITWAPFLVNSWNKLLTTEYVRQATETDSESIYIALGSAPYEPGVGSVVASKLMIVVLADRQERVLTLHGNELSYVRKALLELRNEG